MKAVNGVEWFAVFQANPDKLKLFFPNGEVCCANCDWLYNEHGLNRSRCHQTNEIINYPRITLRSPKVARLSLQER